jgi:phage shock protein A
MGKRLSLIVKAKANKLLDKHEDPRETLDYSYEKQLEMLTQIRRSVADVATSRKRIEIQMQTIQASADKLQNQAQQAVNAGRDDLAKEALTRKAAATAQLADLQTQHDDIAAQEQKLTLASQQLQTKVDAFRTRKETIKASYTAAEAEAKIGEAVSGISEEMGDVGLAMQRAEDKTQQMQARAGAVDELLASGALDDATAIGGGKKDDIQSQLDALSAGSDVDAELAALKAGSPAPAIGSTPAAAPTEEAK